LLRIRVQRGNIGSSAPAVIAYGCCSKN
jgi:hypothetical protein